MKIEVKKESSIFELSNSCMTQNKHQNHKHNRIPVINRFLMSDTLYPLPVSSKSNPDSVLPSQRNCTATAEGVEGPEVTSNLARKDPVPFALTGDISPIFQTAR